MAERKGFEPSNESPRYSLSRGAPSTTRPQLQLRVYIVILLENKWKIMYYFTFFNLAGFFYSIVTFKKSPKSFSSLLVL